MTQFNNSQNTNFVKSMIISIVLGCVCLIAMFVCLAMDSAGFGALMFGLAVLNFGMAYVKYLETQEPKQEKIIETRIPPQIDTTITFANGVADTTYTYHFPPQELDTIE